MKPFKWIWQYIREYKHRMAAGLVLALIVSGLNMVNPYISGVVVDDVIYGGKTDLLIPIIGILIGVTIGKSILFYVYQILFERISQNVVFNIRETIYTRMQEQDFHFFDRTKTGDIMSRMTGDTEAIRHFVAWVIYQIFSNGTVFIFALIMMFTVNVKLTLSLLILTPVVGFFAYKMANTVRPTFMAIREAFSNLNSVVQENISGNRVVKAFAKEHYEIEKFSKANDEFKEKNLDSAKIWERYLPVLDSLATLLSVVIILVGGVLVMNHIITMGELVVFNGYIWALNNPMRMAGWLINDVQRFAASTEKVMSILEVEPTIKNSEKTVAKREIKGTVEFHNVSFCYQDEPILENINFSAHAGQTIAIIGPTGSGKSTLVNLICRFYDCNEGEIRIDGVNVRDLNMQELRKNVAVAMQDIFLFSDTIEGNIAYGEPRASMEQVEWAAGVAGVHEFINNFREGYNTIVGERGVGLSGGQKQRIALARALLKNPSILILDDTTSSVDMETEHKIHKALRDINQNRTTFIIAHRISSVKNADMILVLDHGKIIEKGKHDDLLKKRGYYYSVFVNQFGDFDNIVGQEVG